MTRCDEALKAQRKHQAARLGTGGGAEPGVGPGMEPDVEPGANIGANVGAGVGFDRVRRITGYLVGTVNRFNNAKRAELQDRRAHEHN